MHSINIGISDTDRTQVAQSLKTILADSYTLYLQTHFFHWNVYGPQFRELHLMFEEQYNELAVAVDDIAERIRALDEQAPGSYKAFAKLTTLTEVEDCPDAKSILEILTSNHEKVIISCRKALEVAQKANDESSAGLISDRLRVHEKTAWMLRVTGR